MNNECYTACVLFEGSEAECVTRAVNLIGTVLNCCDCSIGKRALLICTRSSWEEALDGLDNRLASHFHGGTFSFPCKNERITAPDPREFLNRLLELTFSSDIADADLSKHLSTNTNSTCSSRFYSDSGSTILDVDAIQTEPSRTDYLKSLGYTPEEMEELINNQDSLADNLQRVLIRFVEEDPSRRTVDDVVVEFSTEAALNPFWSYIQAANEICSHGDAVDYVIVAGLSDFLMRSIPGFPSNAAQKMHPFTAIGMSEGSSRIYQSRILSMYTMALSLSINAAHSRIKGTDQISGCYRGQLPRLFLVETLPSDPEDSAKFTKFISERVDFTYNLR